MPGKLTVVCIWILALGFSSSARALKPEIGYRVVPSDYGIICDEVTFEASDSVALSGWFFPAQDTTGIANHLVGRLIPVPPELRPRERSYRLLDADQRPTVVICCGDAGNMSYLILYAYHLFIHGFNVLTFDWRGFGESDPWPVDMDQLVYSEFLLDYDAAIDLAKARPETDPSRIGLLGFSTGAYLSFAMTAKRDDIAVLIGRAMLTSFEDIIPILTELDPERGFHAPEDYPTELLPVNAAGNVTTPVLLVVGENDDRTPPWMSRRLFQLLAGPKELWIVPGAGHGGRLAPEIVGYPQFFVRARTFFKCHLASDED
jgi:hypothetical protein